MALTRDLARSRRPWVRAMSRLLRVFRPRVALPRSTDPGAVRTVLVTELWNLGDVVLAMPFLAKLRELFPQARIVLLGKPHAGVLLEGTGLLDEFVPFDFPWTHATGKYSVWKYSPRALGRLFRDLRGKHFDLAFDCRMDARANLVLYLSGATRRVGYAFGGAEWLLTDPLPIENFDKHKSADWLGLLEPFGGSAAHTPPRLLTSSDERDWATSFLRRNGVQAGEIVVGVHPGASRPEKRWPLDRFAAVARNITARSDTRVLLFVDPSGYGRKLADQTDVIVAQPTLRQMLALIQRCAVLVCNDSGPMHIAAAVGVPVVALFGSWTAEWYGPMGEGHRVVTGRGSQCRPRYAPGRFSGALGLTGIETEEVLAAVDATLSRVAATEAASIPS